MSAPTCPSWCDGRRDPAACELVDAGTPDAGRFHRVRLDELVEVAQWARQDGTPPDAPGVVLLPAADDMTGQDAREVAAALVRAAQLVEGEPVRVEHSPDAGHLVGCDRAHDVEAWDLHEVLPRTRDRAAFWDFHEALRARGVQLAGTRTRRYNEQGETCGWTVTVRSCELLRFRAVQAATDAAILAAVDGVAGGVR